MKKEVWSGSNNQRYGSGDPDPHQNVTDPQHCLKVKKMLCCVSGSGLDQIPLGQWARIWLWKVENSNEEIHLLMCSLWMAGVICTDSFVLLDVPLNTGKLDPLEEVHMLQAFWATCTRSSLCETQSVPLYFLMSLQHRQTWPSWRGAYVASILSYMC